MATPKLWSLLAELKSPSYKWVDLTHAFDDGSPHWQGFPAMTTKLIGKKTALFRPPYGEYNDTVITTVRGLGYEVIQWDIDTVDTEWMTGS